MTMTDIDGPAITWDQSADRTRMIIALREGQIPLKAKDPDGRRTTDVDHVWRSWCPNYSRVKLPRRLAALRKIVTGELQPNGFKEPRKWENSAAYKLLEEDIRNGVVDVRPNTTKEDIDMVYLMRPEYAAFDHQKFGKRLEALQKSAGKSASRAQEDEKSFEAFVSFNTVSLFSRKGYEQWQGSDAQKKMLEDIAANKHLKMRKRDLYGSCPEYYDHFTLKAFRDFLKQEIRTGKWRHTLAVKGKNFKAS